MLLELSKDFFISADLITQIVYDRSKRCINIYFVGTKNPTVLQDCNYDQFKELSTTINNCL